ncbi:MAG: nitroreductase family protein [Ignavibacteria bacterium]|nr:nitroreductase family protein [Ignavibacteria bacterium]
MEFKQAVELRASVRTFTDSPIPQEDIREILRLATCAPCIGGSEFWKYLVITDKALLSQIAGIVREKYNSLIPQDGNPVHANIKVAVEKFSSVIASAPAVIAVLTEPYEALIDNVLAANGLSHNDMNSLRNHPDIQTVGAVVQTLLLSAVNAGYTGCWLSGPMIAKNEISSILAIQEPFSLSAFVAIGNPGAPVAPRVKKDVDEMIEWR